MPGFVLTYLSRQLSTPEAHADCDVEAVLVLVALVALWHSDVDGDRQEDGDIHRNDRPGPKTISADGGTQCGRDRSSNRVRGRKKKHCCVTEIYSPQQHHAICHESSNSDICNENIGLKSHKEDVILMQHLLTALITPANPKQCTEVF